MAVGCSHGELQEHKSAQLGGLLYMSDGSADADCWSKRVDVGARCTFGQVDANGYTFEYSGVKEREWGREGGASRGRDRGVCRFGKSLV